jgi:diadenylate cyclase
MGILHHWKIILEIALLWYFIYMALSFIKGTRTEQLLKGVIIIIIIFIATQQLQFEALNWVITRLFPISVIALLVIFQPELRRGLARLGQFGVYEDDIEAIEEVSKAVISMTKKKTGALIVIEREVGLKTYIETGITIDSRVSKELLVSIFMPKGPLHDGAVIIKRDRVVAAGCLLPLTQEASYLSTSLGTRHRAAIGLTEETDALCIVVSEETGTISLSVNGHLTRNIEKDHLATMLKNMSYKRKMKNAWYLKMLSKVSPKVT